MLIEGIELITVRLPLVAPFRSSEGVQTHRAALLVRVITEHAIGWGECVAQAEPTYSPEYLHAERDVIERFAGPALLRNARLAHGPTGASTSSASTSSASTSSASTSGASTSSASTSSASSSGQALAFIKGHRMAKAALVGAVLDAELRAQGMRLADALGATRAAVDAGVSVSIASSVAELVASVEGFVAEGYRRIKLKIEPGWDLEPVAAVRTAIGPDVRLQVDANGAYTLADVDRLAALDEYDLLLIEQPLADDDLVGHAALAAQLRTPVCLDESIVSVDTARSALALGACSVINLKPGRVGGLLEAKRIHDLCVDEGVALWCGGMFETGVGRAANVALAALPGFTLPGDLSGSDRYFSNDLTEPFVLEDGRLRVPSGPGIGVEPLEERLRATTVERRLIR